MVITCKECGLRFNSVIILAEEAWKEVYNKLGKHYEKDHPIVLKDHAVAVQRIASLMVGYLTITELTIVPEDQEWINGHMEKMQDMIMEAMGFDVEEEIDDNLEVMPEETESTQISEPSPEHTVS